MKLKTEIPEGKQILGMYMVINGEIYTQYREIDWNDIPKLKRLIAALLMGLQTRLKMLGFCKELDSINGKRLYDNMYPSINGVDNEN